MTLLYIVLLLFIVVLIWRINHPGDLRLTKGLVGRYVRDLQGRGPTYLRAARLTTGMLTADQTDERVFYSLEAGFADGSKRSLLAQIVYPLESLQRERERRKMSGSEDMIDPMSSPMSMQRGDSIERLKEDPFKELAREEQAITAKAKQLEYELNGLRQLNRVGVLFPRLLGYDAKRMITLTEGVGNIHLDDLLQKQGQPERVAILRPILTDLAALHSRGKGYIDYFQPGPGHTEKRITDELQNSLSTWDQIGAAITAEDFLEIVNSADALFETANVEKGLRLADSSPRAFLFDGSKASLLNWFGVRTDISLFDVVELVCDPATGLSADAELELFDHYLEQLCLPVEQLETTGRQLRCLAIYFRLVLIGYLVHYRMAKFDRQVGIKYWGSDAIAHAAKNLLVELAAVPELADLLAKLEPALSVMEGLK